MLEIARVGEVIGGSPVAGHVSLVFLGIKGRINHKINETSPVS